MEGVGKHLAGEPLGWYLICPKPLAALATISPVWPVLVSCTTVAKPSGVSVNVTVAWSPWLRKKVSALSGFPDVDGLNWSGLGGPNGLPSVVRKAKLMYSIPPRISRWQVGFSVVPLLGFSDRLSMFSATHHLVALQLEPANCGIHPGG